MAKKKNISKTDFTMELDLDTGVFTLKSKSTGGRSALHQFKNVSLQDFSNMVHEANRELTSYLKIGNLIKCERVD